MQKIAPFLWFDDKAEEAMNFYVSIFKNSKIVSISRYGEGGRAQGHGHDRNLRARRAEIYGPQWRPAFQVLASHFVFRELRNANRSRRVAGKALRRRRETTMRLGHRQVWCVLADYSNCTRQDVERCGSGEIEKCHESHASNGQA